MELSRRPGWACFTHFCTLGTSNSIFTDQTFNKHCCINEKKVFKLNRMNSYPYRKLGYPQQLISQTYQIVSIRLSMPIVNGKGKLKS